MSRGVVCDYCGGAATSRGDSYGRPLSDPGWLFVRVHVASADDEDQQPDDVVVDFCSGRCYAAWTDRRFADPEVAAGEPEVIA